ncbi:MAG: cell cycle transcriptional regulator TrcR, partial [Pseudomonadota bacterium]|nr:cell cycle transcriptional regulator TrcR [Pseudomonadota bacterium]
RNHPELLDAQISRLIGTTKSTIEAIRDRTHWNSAYLTPVDPVSIGLCTQVDLDKEVKKASKRIENKKKKEEKELLTSTTIDEANESILAPVNDEVVEEIKEEVIETINEEPEEKKEYDTDSVFAKLQELKKE